MSCYEKSNITEVSLEYPLYQSQKGKYFIGETPLIEGYNSKPLCLLINPITSKVNLYLNAMTITNLSNNYYVAKFYLGGNLSGGLNSNSISCTNLSIKPLPNPNGKIEYFSNSLQLPPNSIPIFTRIVSPLSTLVIDGGQIIISPGNALSIYLDKPLTSNDYVIFAYGWWESPLNNRSCYFKQKN